MKITLILGIIGALAIHAGALVVGELLFAHDEEDHGTLQQVELMNEVEVPEKQEDTKPEDVQELQTETEDVPDASEIINNLEETPMDAPRLDAASLGAIEAALNGEGAGGDFAQSLDFASGGRIGGTGKAGALDDQLEAAFSLAEIDQKPRATFQSSPIYPNEMRGKRVEGSVTLIFVVDAAGKVANPRVERASHVAFEKPALDAVKRWRFEPAVKGGQRVACRMRAPIRFQPS